jgi:hypothetical protein
MSIRIFANPYLHRLDRNEDDERIGWTLCGLRFSWLGTDWDWSHDSVQGRTRCLRCWP